VTVGPLCCAKGIVFGSLVWNRGLTPITQTWLRAVGAKYVIYIVITVLGFFVGGTRLTHRLHVALYEQFKGIIFMSEGADRQKFVLLVRSVAGGGATCEVC